MTTNVKVITMAMVIAMIGIVVPKAYGGGGGCYDVGYEDGRNGEFERDAFTDNCGSLNTENRYYKGFIDGCMTVEGNTRDVCESATD